MANNNDKKVLNVPALRFPEFSGEWKHVHLKEIAEFQKQRISTALLNNNNYISTENILQDFEGIQCSSSMPANVNVIKYQNEDILLSNIRPYLKKVWFADRKGGCSADVLVLRGNKCDKYFLYYVIASDRFINYVMSGIKGVKMPRGDKNQMEEYAFSIPTNMEQKRIAKFISILDERIRLQNKIIEKYESLIQAISQKVLRPSEYWNEYRLCELADIRSGYSGNQVSHKTAYAVSRIETISKHRIDMLRVGYVQDIPSEYKLNVGDILFSNINSIQYIGNTAFVDKEYNLYHGMNLLRIIPKPSLVIPRFLHLILCTSMAIKHFQSICNKAVSQASINQTSLGKIMLHIPPLTCQEQICNVFESVEQRLNLEVYYLKRIQLQKNYLLRQMFI